MHASSAFIKAVHAITINNKLTKLDRMVKELSQDPRNVKRRAKTVENRGGEVLFIPAKKGLTPDSGVSYPLTPEIGHFPV